VHHSIDEVSNKTSVCCIASLTFFFEAEDKNAGAGQNQIFPATLLIACELMTSIH